MKVRLRLRVVAGVCLVAAVLAGCTTGSRQAQLERVAKDWCLTIRASQVMPVYPLRDDIQPGDLYVVNMPIDRQHEQFKKKGYLPLPNEFYRLQPENYPMFYNNSFLFDHDGVTIPAYWMNETYEGAPSAWHSAPLAGFPSYKFSVRRGGGFDAALPIQGIPVAINLTGAKAADGTVSLKDARTYGVDSLTLEQQVRDWAEDPRVAKALLPYATPLEGAARNELRYLRVVNRVYLVKEFDVSLNASATTGGGILANLDQSATVPEISTTGTPLERTATDYAAFLKHVNETLDARRAALNPQENEEDGETPEEPGDEEPADGSTPEEKPAAPKAGLGAGGAVLSPPTATDIVKKVLAKSKKPKGPALPKGAGVALTVTAASARTVSLTETFARPLVVGYLGFDMALYESGGELILGTALPTYEVVKKETPEKAPTRFSGIEMNYNKQYERLRALEEPTRSKVAYRVLKRLGLADNLAENSPVDLVNYSETITKYFLEVKDERRDRRKVEAAQILAEEIDAAA